MSGSADIHDLKLGHMTFRIRVGADGGDTFSVLAGEAMDAKDRKKVLFSGPIEPSMAQEARELSWFFRELTEGMECLPD